MRYGNCVPFKNANHIKILKAAGFDYIETNLSAFLDASESEITDFLSSLKENNITCEAVNVLFPGGIILTGEQADYPKVADYINIIFEKTKNIGFKTVVFGSGGARKCPDGFPKEKAIEQIIEVAGRFLLPAAEKYDFTLAIEELHRGETNIINTIDEAEYIAEQINNPRIKVLADLYHIGLENDDATKLSQKGGMLAHCHIANPYNGRKYPQASDSSEAIELYKKFFSSLKSAGYIKTLSIEGGLGGLLDCDFDKTEIPEWVEKDDRLFYAESKKSLEFMISL